MVSKIKRTLAEYFPPVDLPIKAFQDWAIVQMKRSFDDNKTAGGVLLPGAKSSDEKGQQEWHETTAKVISIGPVFQKTRDTLEYWPECRDDSSNIIKLGDIVRIPEHLAGRFTVQTSDGDEIKCIFVRDINIMGASVGDPIETIDRVKSYVPLTERKVR